MSEQLYPSQYSEIITLTEQIAKPFESCSLSAYWDPVGFPTIGWGHLLSRVTKQQVMQQHGFSSVEADQWLKQTWPDITQDEADKLFEIDLSKAYKSVLRLVKVQLKPTQLAALTDFAFNCGSGNLQISTLLKMVNRCDFIEAADEFLKWDKARGIKLRGLTRRRRSERCLFLS